MMARAGGFGDVHRLGRKLLGPQIAGWRVGKVARQKHRAGKPLNAAAVGAAWPGEGGGGPALGAVAREDVGGERPTQSEPSRVHALGNGIDAVARFRKRS